MAKIAYDYYKIDPWMIIEEGYDPKRNEVSESIFSLGNEYMGIRGMFEEGVSAPSLVGSYFNGVYEYGDNSHESHYKGVVKRGHFMVNSVNWLYTNLLINGEKLDLAKHNFIDFNRSLNLRNGLLMRSFTLVENNKKLLTITFERFISMTKHNNGYQKIDFIPHKNDVQVELHMGLDFSILHGRDKNYWNVDDSFISATSAYMIGQTKTTKQSVFSGYKLSTTDDVMIERIDEKDKIISHKITFETVENNKVTISKRVTNVVYKEEKAVEDIVKDNKAVMDSTEKYNAALHIQNIYFKKVWNEIDIEINGDVKNQQGIRFCLFQLQQTYNGVDPSNNIGAKGLTGEAYSGHAFWDTETYCLPFFLFTNPKAARNLLLFRYKSLNHARQRAIDLDCEGACFPIATLNGEEGCTLWQHASLQFQPSTAVAYGIFHYFKHTSDFEFLHEYGIEMLIEIARFLASRGQWNNSKTKFGYYGVMGPDEFQMMVNHNGYTNYMAKKTFDYTIETLKDLKNNNAAIYRKLSHKLSFNSDEIGNWQELSDLMYIPFDKESKIYEQHDGFFDLPHIDVDSIPVTDFPLYSNWSYDRIYRNNMIKQPDVLMFMFLYNQSFTTEEKRANYDFYEPLTIHESSLSPSIHSVFAAELGKEKEAVDFFGFATRMDLDDYNRNTHEGLHTTSIAAAWVNIVYGFGGLRTDGNNVTINPMIPNDWDSYSFKFKLNDTLLKVLVNKEKVAISNIGHDVTLNIYGENVTISGEVVLDTK